MLNIYQKSSYWCGHAEPRRGLGSEALVRRAGCWIASFGKKEHSLPGKGRRGSSIGGGKKKRAACSVPAEAEALTGAWTGHKDTVLNSFMCLRYNAIRLGKDSASALRLYSPVYLKCFAKRQYPSQLCPQIPGDPQQQTEERKQQCHCMGNLHLTWVFLEMK